MPLRGTTEVFNDYVPTSTGTAATAVFTGAQHNAMLGRHNGLGIHVTIDTLTIGTTGSMLLFVDHSADGKNWIQRSKPDNSYATIDADIGITLTSGTTVFAEAMWSDACLGVSKGTSPAAGPLLGFVRFRIFFTQTNIAAHVRVYASQRD